MYISLLALAVNTICISIPCLIYNNFIVNRGYAKPLMPSNSLCCRVQHIFKLGYVNPNYCPEVYSLKIIALGVLVLLSILFSENYRFSLAVALLYMDH